MLVPVSQKQLVHTSFDNYNSNTNIWPHMPDAVSTSEVNPFWSDSFFKVAIKVLNVSDGIQLPKKQYDCCTNIGRNVIYSHYIYK